jgi:hypothetical protein
MHFRGEYDFLSNFYPCQVELDGLRFGSVEAAYQAAKTLDVGERRKFTTASPVEAKRMGRKVKLRPDWNQKREIIMASLLVQKFSNPGLRTRLLQVKGEIVETNQWHDNTWGQCECSKCGNKGTNLLGQMLMLLREKLR